MTALHNHEPDIEAMLAEVTPATHAARDASHFRNIVEARIDEQAAERRLRGAVRDARKAGDSWATIAAALGTSRQAAQQRFARHI